MICSNCNSMLYATAQKCSHCGEAVISEKSPSVIQQWRTLSKTPKFEEDPAVIAGRQGEDWLQSLIENHMNYKGAYSFVGKRVHSSRIRGRKEIDLIIVTPTKLHIIEVKNWSGQLFINGNSWIHAKRDGRTKEYPNLVTYNQEKQNILLQYLAERGIQIARQQISQKVIFPNRNLQVDRNIHSDPTVITLDKLNFYLNEQKRNGIGERMICSVIEYCLSTEKAEAVIDGLFERMTNEKFRKVVDAIQELKTWDRVEFNGSKISNGDLLEIHIGGRTYRGRDFASGTDINIKWTRNKLLGLAKAVFNFGTLGTVSLHGEQPTSVSTQDYMVFHIVGQPQPSAILLSHIDKIRIG